MTTTIPPTVELVEGSRGSAVLSTDGAYRYLLTRSVAPFIADTTGVESRAVFVMLNPSKADADTDDPTVTKCIGFARRMGATELAIVNLFAYRATKPADLVAQHAAGVDIVGPDADLYIEGALLDHHDPDLLVVAWGGRPPKFPEAALNDRIAAVLDLLGPDVVALGATNAGAPRHPSRLGYDVERIRWAPPAGA